MLYSHTGGWLKTVGNGGHVENANGYDIIFTLNDGITKLDHEIVSYDSTAGTFIAWVRIPTLLYNVDTTIRIYYGNSTISASQENANDVWDSNYQGVWHLKEATDASNVDSTGNGNTGTPDNSPVSATGKIFKGLDFSVHNQALTDVGTSIDISGMSSWTISAWVRPFTNYTDNDYPLIYCYGNYDATLGLAVAEGASDGLIEHWRNDNTALYSNTALNINSFNHVVIKYNQGGTTYFRLNGSAVGSGSSVNIDQTNTNEIGGQAGYNDGGLEGIIEEIRVSNVDRDNDLLDTEYANQNSPSTFYTLGSEIGNLSGTTSSTTTTCTTTTTPPP